MEKSDGPQPLRNDMGPQRYYDDFVVNWVRQLGVQVIGGCCGITPDHIAFLRDQLHTAN